MVINLTVKAQVVDIRVDTPFPEDRFLIDTNVWYWLTYTRASLASKIKPPKWYQTNYYPGYLKKALSAKSELTYSGFSLAELAHLIEKVEGEIFNSTTTCQPKEYRHNYPRERASVVDQVQAAWNQVKAIAVPVNLTIDETTTDAALARFGTEPLDGYDLFILETMSKEGITNIITDDGDFATVSGITVFTANWNVINPAQAQNKLLAR